MADMNMGDDVRKKVWNNTTKLFRLPNNQVILPHRFNNIAGWDVWKDADVVKSWLACGALTEDEPLGTPEGGVLATFTTPLSPAPSVFTGRIEPPRSPEGTSSGAEGALASPSPGQGAYGGAPEPLAGV